MWRISTCGSFEPHVVSVSYEAGIAILRAVQLCGLCAFLRFYRMQYCGMSQPFRMADGVASSGEVLRAPACELLAG